MRIVLILVGFCALAVSHLPQPQDQPAAASDGNTFARGDIDLREIALPAAGPLTVCTEEGCTLVTPAAATVATTQGPQRSIVTARRPVVVRSRQVVRGTAQVLLPPYPRVRAIFRNQPVRKLLGVHRRQARRASGCGLFGCR